MPKNIVICCDGTSNKFGKNTTNVVKLFSVLKREGQALFYDPGVGTMADVSIHSKISKKIYKLFGLAFGLGLNKNVEDAYKFLMDNYVDGDKVYLFGYSRGAYTVRVLTGFIYRCGLLLKGNENHIPYAYEIYSQRIIDFELLAKFKKRFSRKCSFHFMGIWDSVSSVGTIGNMRNYPNTISLKNISHIRHAIAIDEWRADYVNNNIIDKKGDLKEVWFRGIHGDVGGGYSEEESGLSKVALQWVLNEAKCYGLLVNEVRELDIVEGEKEDYIEPNPLANQHKLPYYWWLLQLIPRRKIVDFKTEKKEWYWPFLKKRIIPEKSYVHRSVSKYQTVKENYTPTNLPTKVKLEPKTKNA